MDAPTEVEILRYSYKSRLQLFLCQVVFNSLLPDHQADVFNPPRSDDGDTVFDSFINYLLGGFIRWDGVYFLHIAEHGYIYENSLAFFPLFPWIVRAFSNSLLWPLQFVLQYITVLILSGFILNFVIFIWTAVVLFRLTKVLFHSDRFAYQTVVLFCYNPASIFMSAFYSEILFCSLAFSAMLNYETNKSNQSYTSLCCLARSNGALVTGFYAHRTVREIFNRIFLKPLDVISTVLFTLHKLLDLTVYIILSLLPVIIYQLYINDLFCDKKYTWNIPDILKQYGRERSYKILNESDFVWCRKPLPYAYSHVQNTHWNVGFLRYYELKQTPNFILALPVTVLSMSAVLYYYKLNRSCCLTLGLIPAGAKASKPSYGFRSSRLLPYIVYLLFIIVFGWCFIHIQVLTRMVFSSSPVVYWFAAEMILQNSQDGATSHSKDLSNCDIINMFINYKNQSGWTKFVLSYFVCYFIIGTLMFSNFLPWT